MYILDIFWWNFFAEFIRWAIIMVRKKLFFYYVFFPGGNSVAENNYQIPKRFHLLIIHE